MSAALIRFAWELLGIASTVATLPGSVELLGLSAASLFPKPTKADRNTDLFWHVAVIVPAHNEAPSIQACIRSIQDAHQAKFKISLYVVADNCTDDTAERAAAQGAKVLVRESAKRGKGHALHHAFTVLASTGYDCVIVVDADTEVASNFIADAAAAMQSGADGVQAPYMVRNGNENVRTRLMSLAMRGFNVVRPSGRERLGLSVGILGNGFGLRRDTLAEVPYLAASVVEDLEYHLLLIAAGKRIRFLGQTAVYGEAPTGKSGATTQRSRWEGGRLRMLYLKAPKLFAGVVRGQLRFVEPLLDLLLLPLAFHVLLLAVALSTPLLPVRIIASLGLAIVALHLAAASAIGGSGWNDLLALASAPFYVLWKVLMIPKVFRSARGGHVWVRTQRNAEARLVESGTAAGHD